MNGKASYVLVTMCMMIGCAPSDDPHVQQASTPSSTAIAGAAAPVVRPPAAAASVGTPAAGGANALPPVISPPVQNQPTNSASAAGAAAPTAATPPTTVGAPPPAAAAGCKANAPCSHGTDPVIPEPIGECPNMVSGPFAFMGVTSQIWVGTKSQTQKGPIMLYWHGTGGSALTATAELDPTLVQEIMSQGGVIGSITEGLKGDTLDWGVFTTGDYQSADQIVACAVKQLNIDTKRIYVSGASAGGLAAGELVYGEQQDVRLLQLHLVARHARFDALVVIVHGDSEDFLRALLPDHVLVEDRLDLPRFRKWATAAPRIFAVDFFRDDVVAQTDALVADVDGGAGNELLDLLLRFTAEGTLQVPVTIFSAPINHGSVSLSLKSLLPLV
jgi:hypothetical protein